MSEEDYEQDELVEVKLPRYQLEILKTIVKREELYAWWKSRLTNNWIFLVGGGTLTLILLWEKIQHLIGVKP